MPGFTTVGSGEKVTATVAASNSMSPAHTRISWRVSRPIRLGPRQVEDGKEEHPDDVDEVPVEAAHFRNDGLLRHARSLGQHADRGPTQNAQEIGRASCRERV